MLLWRSRSFPPSLPPSRLQMEIPGLPNAPKELLTAGAGLLAFALLFAIGPGAAIGVTLCEAFIGMREDDQSTYLT